MNAELLLMHIRSHPALWGDLGPEKEAQAERILRACKRRLAPKWKARAEEVRHAAGQRMLNTWA